MYGTVRYGSIVQLTSEWTATPGASVEDPFREADGNGDNWTNDTGMVSEGEGGVLPVRRGRGASHGFAQGCAWVCGCGCVWVDGCGCVGVGVDWWVGWMGGMGGWMGVDGWMVSFVPCWIYTSTGSSIVVECCTLLPVWIAA